MNDTDCPEITVIPEIEGAEWGAPATITAETLKIDAASARRMKCRCGHRGLTHEPCRKAGVYCALARCPRCMKAEEM